MNESLPLILAFIGVGCMIGLSGAGSAIGVSIAGSSTLGALKKKSEAFGSYMVLSAMPGTQGLYGFGGFFIMIGRLNENITLFQGAAILGAGLAMGIACLISAIYQGKVCSNGIAGIGSGYDLFGRSVIIGVYPELYAIVSFAAVFLINGLL